MTLKNTAIPEVISIENDRLSISVVPALGGKILSIYNKALQKDFLWNNHNLALAYLEPGADYDSNFTGGIDELIPNDIPETINSINYPDHGELWTTALHLRSDNNSITVEGQLKLSGLFYKRTLTLDPSAPAIKTDYLITNNSQEERHFLWKLHAALKINEDDQLITSARRARVVDPSYSRFKNNLSEFSWPTIENIDASFVPAVTNTMDFLYLYDIPDGEMQVVSKQGHLFSYRYDTRIFPYQWWFASYGGFLDHYVAILEPCTNMPMSVNEAAAINQSAVLQPGESIHTTVTIFAGEKKDYIS